MLPYFHHELCDDGPSAFGGRNYCYRCWTTQQAFGYDFCLHVAQRSEISWEPHCWNSAKILVPEAPLSLWAGEILYIHNELKRVEPNFVHLIGKFERPTLRAQQRLFRAVFDLVEIATERQIHNGVPAEVVTVKFCLKNNRGDGSYCMKQYKWMWE